MSAEQQPHATPKETQYDVLAIGNAIVDILVRADDSFLKALTLEKSSMSLLDDQKAKELFAYFASIKQNTDSFSSIEIKEMSGGTAANAISGITSFGGKAAFIGKVSSDEYGKDFKAKLTDRGISFSTTELTGDATTGRCLVIVTQDGARTMCTYLGASAHITNDDIDEELIAHSKILFLTAYSWDSDTSKTAVLKAIELAHKHGCKVAFTLSDPSCVTRHRDQLLTLIDEHIDILFANEEEITALFATNDHAVAVQNSAEKCRGNDKIIALTCGAAGAMVISKDGTVKVPCELVDNIVDTTGAGAAFVSGFLYAKTHGFDLKQSAQLGNYAAAEVIQMFGARPATDLRKLIVKL